MKISLGIKTDLNNFVSPIKKDIIVMPIYSTAKYKKNTKEHESNKKGLNINIKL